MNQEEPVSNTESGQDLDLERLSTRPPTESGAALHADQLSYHSTSSPSSSGSLSSGSSVIDHTVQGTLLGYEYEFVPPVDAKYICPICMFILRSPVQTECGHRFCANCIRLWLTQNVGKSKCPNCNDKITGSQIFPDNFAKREIMNLTLRCPNVKNGCNVMLDLHRVQSHLDSVCQYALCPCPNNCSDILLKKDLHHHVTVTCSKLWITCNMCQEKISSSNHQSHMLTCRMSMDLCPYCGKRFFRNKLKSHQETDCPQVTVSCIYQPFGCSHRCSREIQSKHVETSVSDHLHMVTKHVMTLVQQVNAMPHAQLSGLFHPVRYQKIEPSQLPMFLPKLESQELNQDLCDLMTTMTDAGFESAISSPSLDTLHQRNLLPGNRPVFAVEGSYESPEIHSMDSSAGSCESRLSVDDARYATTLYELRQSISQLQQVVAQQAERISKLESLPEEIAARHCNGCYLWRIDNVDKHRQAARNGTATALHSRGFYTSLYGYKLCVRINLNGIEKGSNKHVALFVHFMKGDCDDTLDWPFHGTITLSILDQDKSVDGIRKNYTESLQANPNLAAFAKPSTSRNHKGFGYIEFAPLAILDEPRYVKNSVLFIEATVKASDILLPS